MVLESLVPGTYRIMHCERFVTDKTKDIFTRAWDVSRKVGALAMQYEVDSTAVEGLAFGKFGDATRDLAGLQFCVVNVIRQICKGELTIITPNTVKKVATGKGNSKKEPMYDALPDDVKGLFEQKKYKKTTGRYDLTDAYWIGVSAIEAKRREQKKESVLLVETTQQ